MKQPRNIGQGILAGLQEIKEWQQRNRKLKTTEFKLPKASDVPHIRVDIALYIAIIYIILYG